MSDPTRTAPGAPPRVGVADPEDVLRRATAGSGRSLSGLEVLQGGASSLTYAARTGDGTRVVVKVAPPGLEPVRNRDLSVASRMPGWGLQGRIPETG